MGLVNENLLTKGFSGKVGDEIVFRQVKTRTVEVRTQVSKRPRKRALADGSVCAGIHREVEAFVYSTIVNVVSPSHEGMPCRACVCPLAARHNNTGERVSFAQRLFKNFFCIPK